MYTRLADLQDFVDVPEEGAYLGADVPQRSNCDKASTTGTWEKSCWNYVGLLNY